MSAPRRLPVIIRRVREDSSLIAFFPSQPWTRRGRDMTSYALLGQHSGASREFYDEATSRPDSMAAPDVVAFLRHLRGIYGSGSDAAHLVLRERLHPAYFTKTERP